MGAAVPIPSQCMDLSAKVLREVEFRDRLRGYDTDEVDEFLEKVAAAVDDFRAQMADLTERAEHAERSLSERAVGEDEDSIRRTLILAQRTADLAIREAQEQASQLMDNARAEAESLVTEARENAQRITVEADRRMHDEVARLEEQRDQVHGELSGLNGLLETERARLAEALSAALHFVERTLTPSAEVAALRPMPGAPRSGVLDDLEDQINEDAAAAAPSPPPVREDDADDPEFGRDVSRSSLSAVPPLAESGPDTEAWYHDEMFPLDDPSFDPPTGDTGSWRLGTGRADWTA
jgi:cell division initiation protein